MVVLALVSAGPASSQLARTAAAPVNKTPPTISGTPAEGSKLTGDRGTWTNTPGDYNETWTRCDKTGSSCATISGSAGRTYVLTSADVGNTVRFRVGAANGGERTFAASAPSAVITAAAVPAPAAATGCPAGTGIVQAAELSLPARLLLDGQQTSPSVVVRGGGQLVVRYHVTACGGRSVAGAMVYATAVPFSQFSVPAEQATNSDGWAEVTFSTLAGFPVSPHQGARDLRAGAEGRGGSPRRRVHPPALLRAGEPARLTREGGGRRDRAVGSPRPGAFRGGRRAVFP